MVRTVLCNCDGPDSNFVKYFVDNFEELKLKKLVVIGYKNRQKELVSQGSFEASIYLEYDGKNKIEKYLRGDGDFRSQECIGILKQSDVVVTNPPFSLFREYLSQIIKYEKQFLIVGHQNNMSNNEAFKLLKNNEMWLGYGFKGGAGHFISSYNDRAVAEDHKEGMIRVPGVTWFTNLEIDKCYEDLVLSKKYTLDEYPMYYNYDAINVNRTRDIPMDYEGAMGVPITFMNKYNRTQFEIIGLAADKREIHDAFVQGRPTYLDEQHKKHVGMILKEGDKLYAMYSRIIIRHKVKI